MKRTITIITSAALLTILSLQAQTPESEKTQQLIKKYECYTCHNNTKERYGPTFEEIALRYKDNPNALTALSAIVKNGNKGNWAEVSKDSPMPPYSGRLSDDQIKDIIKWMLHK
jgi:cytochrome c